MTSDRLPRSRGGREQEVAKTTELTTLSPSPSYRRAATLTQYRRWPALETECLASAQSRNRTNERKSFVLWVTIGAQSDSEYLNTIAITAPKTKIVIAVSSLRMWRASHPGT